MTTPAKTPPVDPNRVAKALLAAPDPLYAVAHFVAEEEHRLDSLGRIVAGLEEQIRTLRHRIDKAGIA